MRDERETSRENDASFAEGWESQEENVAHISSSTSPTAAGAQNKLSTRIRRKLSNEVLGEIVGLFAQSPKHRHLFLSDLEWLLAPPLSLGQLRVVRGENGEAIAVVIWARVSEEVASKLLSKTRLQPGDWNSGSQVWIVDVIAPKLTETPEAMHSIVAQVAKSAFPGEVFKLQLFDKKTGKMRVAEGSVTDAGTKP